MRSRTGYLGVMTDPASSTAADVPPADANKPRREFGSYAAEARAVQEATGKAIGAIARTRVNEIIPEENTRRFVHGGGWELPASIEPAHNKTMLVKDSYSVQYADVVNNDLSIISKSIMGIAERMAEGQIRGVFEAVSDVCDKSGNIVDGAQRPMPEAFLEMLEKIEFGVDSKGEISMPTVFLAPGMVDTVVNNLNSQPPEYQARAEALIEEKKAAARERERERLARFRTLDD